MGYALVIAPEASTELQRIEPWLQEEVLDELEELLEDPPLTPPEFRAYRMLRLRGNDPYVVFLRLRVEPARATLTLLGVSTRR